MGKTNHCSTPFEYSMTFLLQSSLARAIFCPSAQGHGCITTSPEEVHDDGQRAGALLCKQAERAGAVQLGEEKDLGRPYSDLSVPIGYLQESWRRTLPECGDERMVLK